MILNFSASGYSSSISIGSVSFLSYFFTISSFFSGIASSYVFSSEAFVVDADLPQILPDIVEFKLDTSLLRQFELEDWLYYWLFGSEVPFWVF
jgi:hypothetical protein